MELKLGSERSSLCERARLRGREVARDFLCFLLPITVLPLIAADSPGSSTSGNSYSPPSGFFEPAPTSIWQAGLGEGFKPSTESIGLSLGASYGVSVLGGTERHALALAGISYGRMLTCVWGQGHWYRGNWELRGELVGGVEFDPGDEWVVGLTPHLRYNFATGSRWMPFIDAGAGVTATSIGPPDLSNTFEFNLQGCVGVYYLLKDNLALCVECRYLHLSCARLSSPNNGLNTVVGMVGVNFFF
jgi:lipid A 3-O-deacylase